MSFGAFNQLRISVQWNFTTEVGISVFLSATKAILIEVPNVKTCV